MICMCVCVLPPNINTNQKPKEVDIWGGPYMYICIYKNVHVRVMSVSLNKNPSVPWLMEEDRCYFSLVGASISIVYIYVYL